jgi:hypothetical protein
MAALVAIEPGNEQNWHPPEMRSEKAAEQKELIQQYNEDKGEESLFHVFFIGGLRIPFNQSSIQDCPQGAYCPKVPSCKIPYDWKTCGNSAFAYKSKSFLSIFTLPTVHKPISRR